MIYKSYQVEENIDLLKNNTTLFFGENIGLINDFKKKIKEKNKKFKILNYVQGDLLTNNHFFNEIKNKSLFDEKKIYFISDVNDKIFELIQDILSYANDEKIYLFAEILDKKSKLRNYYEKEKKCDVVPCYPDNELSIKKLVTNKLKGFEGVDTKVLNFLIENSNLSRFKINEELEKIITFFLNKKINIKDLEKLINNNENDDVNILKDQAILGNAIKTNKLLSNTHLEKDKLPFYIAIINKRLNRLKDVVDLSKNSSISEAINTLKPPIFWKDKKEFTDQAKIWDRHKINKALEKTYDLEITIKSNAEIDKLVVFKKLILDLCLIANS